MKDLSDAELLAEYAKRKLERNGVCTNGYDFMKGITLGFLVGRVSAITLPHGTLNMIDNTAASNAVLAQFMLQCSFFVKTVLKMKNVVNTILSTDVSTTFLMLNNIYSCIFINAMKT